ncbi:hypothetical protein Hanom_Chr03g00267381 [Helianthus anomalus]
MYVLRCPLMSASSFTPPRDIRMNFLPSAAAIDDAKDVFPTPGGPTKHNTGLLASGFSCIWMIKLVISNQVSSNKF